MDAQIAKIRPEEIRFDFIRASGPGGQNVNKVSTAVQLRFNVRTSQSLKPEIRERLLRIAGKRVNALGEIVIEARRFRTQQRNREDAMERLMQMIQKAAVPPKVRRKSRPPAASNLKRLREKKKRADIKKLRSHAPLDE
ncbi:MAG: aminoacyl-tRNA hydrolase [Acidobacteria bacterium]|nr:aminoacyl-tRNA hydrolase [Acidobacteriota bacterium]